MLVQRVCAIVMCLFIAISFDRCVTGCSNSGGGIANGESRYDKNTPKVKSPLIYPGGGSRDWSRVDYESQSVFGAEFPTDPDLRRQYFKDMDAESDRLEQEWIREKLER